MVGNIINALLYQFVWFTCVLGGNHWVPAAILAILLQVWLGGTWRADLRMMGILLITGLVIDGILQVTGVLVFTEPGWPIPLWLVMVWLGLANTVNHSLAWLIHRPVMSAILGGLGGPLAYWAGTKVDAATFGYGLPVTLSLLAVVWALLFLVLSWFVRDKQPLSPLRKTQSRQ